VKKANIKSLYSVQLYGIPEKEKNMVKKEHGLPRLGRGQRRGVGEAPRTVRALKKLSDTIMGGHMSLVVSKTI
jgi:hypothetical protein